MPTITSIQEQRRQKERVSVFLDEEFWTGMTKDCFLELGLHHGQVLTAAAKKQAEARVAETDALSYCLTVLSARAMSKHTLAEKMRKREYSEDVIAAALARCEELLLLNDELFATSLAEGRRALGHGRRRVAQSLREKGIDRDTAEQVLSDVFDDVDETDDAEAALRAKFSEPLDRRAQNRAFQFLVRRGFSPAAAQAAVARHLSGEEDEEAAPEIDAEQAAVLIQGRYRDFDGSDFAAVRKATAFLMRRGVRMDVAREACASLRH